MSDSERLHHPYSPSTLPNLEWCPCYRSRQSETPHVRTVAGTRAHGVTETGEDDQRLSDEDAVAAAECLDFLEQRRQLMREAAQRAGSAETVQELKETYLPIDDIPYDDCQSTTAGYIDRALISHDKKYAEGFDWKFGMWPVESPLNNLQVISYSLGLFHHLPSLERTRFWIKQPHLEVTKSAEFLRAEVPSLYLRVKTVVARAWKARKSKRFTAAKPGVPVCTFCDNLGTCDKVCKFACQVGRKFYPLEIPEDISPSTLCGRDQAAMGLRLAGVVKVWAEAYRRQITDRILRREMDLPPGQKIQTMSKRELVDLQKYKASALKYLTEAEFDSTLETTFGAVETLIQDKAPRGVKKTTLEEFQRETEAVGAIRRGAEFGFLRAVAEKE
jgi:hypothetical protein